MKYSVGMTMSVFGEPIGSSDPYKQCLDWSVGHFGAFPGAT